MTLDDYQKKTAETAIYLNKAKALKPTPEQMFKMIELGYLGNGLGEAGEIQGKLKKIIRDKGGNFDSTDAKEIEKEIGDVLWYLARLCDVLGISLQSAMEGNIEKLFSRKERGVLEGNGDNR